MKTMNISITCIILFLLSFELFGQENPDKRTIKGYSIKNEVLVVGDLSVLKDQKTFSVIVDPHIDNRMGAENETDSIYIANRIKEFSKTPDKWLVAWYESHKNLKAAFIEGFNSKIKKKGIHVGLHDTLTEYTLIIYTMTRMEFKGTIYFTLDIDVKNTKDPKNKVVNILSPMYSSGFKTKQYKEGYKHAYFNAGVLVAKYFRKKVF